MKRYPVVFTVLTLCLAGTAAVADERVSAVSVSTLAAVSSAAVEASRPMPAYPVNARRNGYHHGRVLVGYDVSSDGTVRNVQVLEAFPVQVYTRTAVNAVQNWRYVPGTADKRMVEFKFDCD
jgi:TonB family protein